MPRVDELRIPKLGAGPIGLLGAGATEAAQNAKLRLRQAVERAQQVVIRAA